MAQLKLGPASIRWTTQMRTSSILRRALASAVVAVAAIALTMTLALMLMLTLTLGETGAATMTFGSPLSVPATKDTANNLNYAGSNVSVPGSVFHIPHDGADTAPWNTQLASGVPSAPASGQVVSVSLEVAHARAARRR